ncbi:MAG TPA: FxLYD domain-containing protein [Meiothermus sp.]|jgi:hypothetical protein|nr:FxLYD domain-containing protein [Meiothermus sp.]
MRRILVLLTLFVLGAAHAETYKLRVIHWSCIVTDGKATVRGMVQNQSRATLSNIRVNLRVLGPNNVVLGTNSALIENRRLAGGASSLFSASARLRRGTVARCQIWFRNPEVVQIPTLVPPLK